MAWAYLATRRGRATACARFPGDMSRSLTLESSDAPSGSRSVSLPRAGAEEFTCP
jgi:hypothetical protein